MENIEINLNNDIITNLALQAHEKDITLNEHINNILLKTAKETLKIKEFANVEENDDGSITVQIPDKFINHLQWDENTKLIVLQDDNNLIVKEKTDWTIEDAQENIEYIINRVNQTNKPHHICHNGKVIMVIPYNEEILNLFNEK